MTHAGQVDLFESYKEHPYFHFDQQSFTINLDEFNKFNVNYLAAKRLHSSLSVRDYDEICLACCNSIKSIFFDFKNQALDIYENAFLDELLGEAVRLLSEELKTYRYGKTKVEIQLSTSERLNNAVSLDQEKFFFGQLDPDVVRELNELGKSDLEQFRSNVLKGLLRREDLSQNTGNSVKSMIRILNKEYNRNGVNEAVSAYMGKRMIVVALAFELSVPQAKWWENSFSDLSRPPDTLYAHLDGSIDYPKAIVYLTDVGEDNGPTSCYPQLFQNLSLNPFQQIIGRVIGTVGSRKESILYGYYNKSYHQSVGSKEFRKHFMRLPEKIRFNSHLGWDIFPGSRIEKTMIDAEVKMLGSSGKYIIFDGARLFHRGGLMKSGERIALQVIFGKQSFRSIVKSKINGVLGR